jgi:CheY-like chemotaxis protein
MSKSGLNGTERRTAARYSLPGKARVFWAGGDAEAVSISDMSASGCQIVGASLPATGTRVFLSLELAGLPNVRLAASVVRRIEHHGGVHCGVRFEVPADRLTGLSRLLQSQTHPAPSSPLVLVVDSEENSRENVALAVSRTGARVLAVQSALDALRHVRELSVDVLLARADTEGLAALAAISKESSQTFRVAFGRGPSLASAVTLGFAEATADDPCSAKCLSDLMQRKSVPPL